METKKTKCDNEEIGTCDICGKELPISRGENFQWIDEKWKCNDCAHK